MITYSELTLDIARNTNPTAVYAKQGDLKTRFLKIRLEENGRIFTPPEGVTARIKARKPDGKAVFSDAVISDGIITVELPEQALTVAGLMGAELALYEGGQLLSTHKFRVNVEASVLPDEYIESTDEFGALADALASIADSKSDAEQAVKNAQTALETVNGAAERANTAAENAEQKATALEATVEAAVASANEAVQNTTQAIETAQQAAETATGAAETAVQSAETATGKISELTEKAEAAERSAKSAETSAEAASTAAESAKTTAENASRTVQEVKDSLGDYAKKTELFSGNYEDLKNKPEIPEPYDDTELRGKISRVESEIPEPYDDTALKTELKAEISAVEEKIPATAEDISALGINDTAKAAEKLAAPRKINGVEFDGTQDIEIETGGGGSGGGDLSKSDFVTLTQAEYDALEEKTALYYLIKEE